MSASVVIHARNKDRSATRGRVVATTARQMLLVTEANPQRMPTPAKLRYQGEIAATNSFDLPVPMRKPEAMTEHETYAVERATML